MKGINVEGVDSFEKLQEFLIVCGIGVEKVNPNSYGYSRTLEFTIDGQIYNIVWFQNESKLKIGKSDRAPFIMFKNVFLDTTFPLFGGNKCLSFAFNVKNNIGMFDSPYNYSDFKIPLEIN